MSGLQYNLTTGEPYLRLPAPFSNIIITPPRMSDVAPSAAILVDPAVSVWMGPQGPGSTYTVAQAEGWLTKLTARTDALVKELGGATDPHGHKPVDGCPLRHIREEQADGSDVFIGDVGIYRASWSHVLDAEKRARLVAENNARAAGDPDIAWHVAYYLAPSHHGRGLMTVALRTLITQFGIPWMKTKRIVSSALEGNPASLKVLQKNGFVVVDTLVDHIQMQVGEKRRAVYVVEWKGLESMGA
ncbi:Acetyltransferase, GNAT family [Mycena venus]|uniref:Acetyltransferase, GNAT family n=1 Tax=Mycena venus TaxID=2733690 RepID=A0A8H6XSB4_9AGAR|nr:Acetyltransferase, GNAT family [Mycena venus]